MKKKVEENEYTYLSKSDSIACAIATILIITSIVALILWIV